MANRFWVGGTATWDATAGTKWATTSGGAGGAAVPTTGDDVFLDAASGAAVITYGASSTFASLDCTGFTGTLTHGAFTMTLDGTGTNDVLKLVAGMTYTPSANSRIISITNAAASGTFSVTTAGKTLGALVINYVGGTAQLVDALSILAGSGTLTVTAGTFDSNNQTIAAGVLSSTGAGVTRAITLGTSTVTLSQITGSMIDFTSAAGNLTLSAASSTIVLAGTPTGSRGLVLGTSKTWGTITLTNGGGTASPYPTDISAGTDCTIGTLNATSPMLVRFTSAITYSITNPFAIAGTAFNSVVTVIGATGGATKATIAAGASSTFAWCALHGLTFTGTVTATNSFNLGGVTGATITGPGSAGARVIGG